MIACTSTAMSFDAFVVDAVVEILNAVDALGDDVEADTTDVFLGFEVGGGVNLVALDFQFQHADAVQTDLVAIAKVALDDFGESREGRLIDDLV